MIYSIKKIHKATPFKLLLEFDAGEVKEIDLEKHLLEWAEGKQSIFEQLLDPKYFTSVRLNTELETVYWENGVDFSPNSLHMWAVEQEQERNEEVSTNRYL